MDLNTRLNLLLDHRQFVVGQPESTVYLKALDEQIAAVRAEIAEEAAEQLAADADAYEQERD